MKLLPIAQTACISAALGSLACLAGTARAAYPEDVTLSQLDSFGGEAYTNYPEIQLAWKTVAKDLGGGIANRNQGASTLGINGFEVMGKVNMTFVDGHRYQGGATAWERVREGNQGTGGLFMPGFGLRKGLPLSLEVGTQMAWMGMTRQGVFGGYGRFAPLEGMKSWPELALQVGRSAYLGNEELSLATTDMSVALGKTIAFRSGRASRSSTVQPWFTAGLNRVQATPRLPADRLAELGIAALSASKKDEGYDPGMQQVVLGLGSRFVSGDMGMSLTVSLPLNSVPSVETSFGYVF